MIKNIFNEKIENHGEKVGKIIKAQLENMNNRLDRKSQEVVGITKVWNLRKKNLMKNYPD